MEYLIIFLIVCIVGLTVQNIRLRKEVAFAYRCLQGCYAYGEMQKIIKRINKLTAERQEQVKEDLREESKRA